METGFEMVGECGPLFGALAKAQGAFGPVLKGRENPYYKSKYADLADVIEATRPALAANGLCAIQPPSRPDEDATWTVTTIVAHESGAFLRAVAVIPAVADWQKLGSAITYCRRYQLSAMLGVASEEDDDGNASKDTGPSPAALRYEQKQKTQATPPQAEERRPATIPPPAGNPLEGIAPAGRDEPARALTKKRLGDLARSHQVGLSVLQGAAQERFGVPLAELTTEDAFQALILHLFGVAK